MGLGLSVLSAQSAEVPFDFGWPDPLRAQVTQTKYRARERPGQKPSTMNVTASFEMQARRMGPNTQVSFGPLRLVKGAEGLTPAQRSQLELMTRSSLPSYVIDGEGAFVRVHELPAFQASIRSTLDDMMKGLPDREVARKAVDVATQEPMLNALAAQDWNVIVGSWAGGRLEPGETYAVEQEAAVPLLPGLALKMVSTFRMLGDAPCARGGVQRRCVDVEMITEPEPKALAATLEQLIDQLASRMGAGTGGSKPAPDGALKHVEMKTVVRLRTEPAGLIPHSVSMSKTVRLTAMEKGQEQTATQVDEMQTVYRY